MSTFYVSVEILFMLLISIVTMQPKLLLMIFEQHDVAHTSFGENNSVTKSAHLPFYILTIRGCNGELSSPCQEWFV